MRPTRKLPPVIVRVRKQGLVLASSGIFASIFLVLQPPPASAAVYTVAMMAKLEVAGPDTVDVELDRVPANTIDATQAQQRGQARPVVTNTGDAPATLRFAAFLDEGSGRCANADVKVAPRETLTPLQPDATIAPILDLTLREGCAGRQGTILIYGGKGVAPASVRFTLVRAVERLHYWYPLAGGGIVSLLITLVILAARRGRLSKEVATGPSWSLKDSWLTNITALGAILGAVLAATGFLKEVLPGLNTGRLVGLNVAFGGMVLSAPIIYSTASKWVPESSKIDNKDVPTLVAKGRVCGIIFAGTATLWGVFGQIGTMIALTAASDADKSAKLAVWALLIAAGLLVATFAFVWALGVTKDPQPAERAAAPPAAVPVPPTAEVSGTM